MSDDPRQLKRVWEARRQKAADDLAEAEKVLQALEILEEKGISVGGNGLAVPKISKSRLPLAKAARRIISEELSKKPFCNTDLRSRLQRAKGSVVTRGRVRALLDDLQAEGFVGLTQEGFHGRPALYEYIHPKGAD
jgi:hypothetical protein